MKKTEGGGPSVYLSPLIPFYSDWPLKMWEGGSGLELSGLVELYAYEYNYIVLYCNESNRGKFYSSVHIAKIKVERQHNLGSQRKTEEINRQLII